MLSLLKFNEENASVRVFHNLFRTIDITYFIMVKCSYETALPEKFVNSLEKKTEKLKSLDCAETFDQIKSFLEEYKNIVPGFEYAFIIQTEGYFQADSTEGFSILIKHVYRIVDLSDFIKSIRRKFKKKCPDRLYPQPFNSLFIIVDSSRKKKTRLFLGNKSLSDENTALYLRKDNKNFALFSSSDAELGLLSYLTEKPHRIASLLIVFAVFTALVYAFAGGNKLEDELKIQTEIIQERIRNLDIEEMEKILDVKLDRLFMPARETALRKTYEISVPTAITLTPVFDSKNIYLASEQKIFVFDKRNRNLVWQKNFRKNIVATEILDFKRLLLCFDDDTASAVERDSGTLFWETNFESDKERPSGLKPGQISLEMDRRLNGSLILNPSKNKIKIKTILDGTDLTEFSPEEGIDFISKFDSYEKSLYIASGKKLICLKLDVNN
ncbi:MAG: hypothetical protein CSB55_02910 [Candidatus Cloacimonadota bacterium]|nr:MAG: hypothetical protein CSB55_02910 [Candidatus Cloacimonadota bacterium]